MIRLVVLLSLLIVFASCQKNELSSDEQLLKSLQGTWKPAGLSCADGLPMELKKSAQTQSQSELVIDGKNSQLSIRNGQCETITKLNITVQKGLLVWSPAGLKKTTCKNDVPAYFGKLEFKIETNKNYLKIDPLNRDSVPCGVLKRI